MRKSLDIDIVWGGYYATIPADGSEISVFRLLDFNRDAYHAALFTAKFNTVPELEEIAEIEPFIGHAPIDTRALLNKDELRLIGGKPLNRDDLDGYMCYLEAHEVPREQTHELVEQLLDFSHQPPLSLHLEIVDEELVITEPE
jgi:hypothetical protein